MNTELQILYAFQHIHNALLDPVMVFVTNLGTVGWFWIALSVVLLCFPKTRKTAWTSALALTFSLIVVNFVLKNAVARPRPCWIDTNVAMLVPVPKDFSFPSGHSSAGFASAVSIFQYHRRWGIAALVLASLIAVSRMYLFCHWPTDVLAGVLLGIGEAVLAGFIVRFIYRKRSAEQAV